MASFPEIAPGGDKETDKTAPESTKCTQGQSEHTMSSSQASQETNSKCISEDAEKDETKVELTVGREQDNSGTSLKETEQQSGAGCGFSGKKEGATSLFGANIVDYPITPESSEEEEVLQIETVPETNNEKSNIEESEQTKVTENTQLDQSRERVMVSDTLETEKKSDEVADTDGDKHDTDTLPVGNDQAEVLDRVCVEETPMVDDENAEVQSCDRGDKHDIVPDKDELILSSEKKEEKEISSEKTMQDPTEDVQLESDEVKNVESEEIPREQREEAECSSTKTTVEMTPDSLQTSEKKTSIVEFSSQVSAEFVPQVDASDEVLSRLETDVESDPSIKTTQKDEAATDAKLDVDQEAMDVDMIDTQDSFQDQGDATLPIDQITEDAFTPAGLTEDAATPAGLDMEDSAPMSVGLEVEDSDSLLPDTEEIESVSATKITKGRLPITEALMDENSLSMDTVLAMSSTVPEGEVSMASMDISLGRKDCPTPAKRSRPGSVMSTVDPDLEDDGTYPAENLFEYQWPLDGGEWYMLQEQICEYLQIKSFKRKYPDLYRRAVDKNEKDFLRERGVVTETMCDLGLTALRSEEVYDLMHKDYSEKYREYAHVLHEKERQNINNKHKEYGVPKLEKGKMADYIKKAVKSAAEFNAQFQRERREERRAYFDLQTFMIHYPHGRFKKLPPEATKPGAHPVALIPGQFQDYYCRYTADELRYLPLQTALYDPPKKMSSTLVKPTNGEELSEVDESVEDKAASASEGESDGDGSSDSDQSDSEAEETKSKEEPLAEPLPEEKCRICNSVDPPPPEKKASRSKKVKQEKLASDDQEMIKCSECGTVGHPSCLDLTNAMVTVIRTYPWQCMECKTCVECMDPYDEDKMMFCDRCDRGYHTFCVGLRSIPTGKWECRSCKGTETPRARKRVAVTK